MTAEGYANQSRLFSLDEQRLGVCFVNFAKRRGYLPQLLFPEGWASVMKHSIQLLLLLLYCKYINFKGGAVNV